MPGQLQSGGGTGAKGRTFQNLWILPGNSPLPPPPRAPMTRSPAHFERLAGGKEGRAPCGSRGLLPPSTAFQSPPNRIPSSAAREWARDALGKCGPRGYDWGTEGTLEVNRKGAGRGRPLWPPCVHRPAARSDLSRQPWSAFFAISSFLASTLVLRKIFFMLESVLKVRLGSPNLFPRALFFF